MDEHEGSASDRRSRYFLGLIEGAVRFPRTRKEAIRLLCTDPDCYLPLAVAVATQHRGEEGKTAGALITKALEVNQSIEFADAVSKHASSEPAWLASAAILAAKRLLNCLKSGKVKILLEPATLHESLSWWLSHQKVFQEALFHARRAVKLFRAGAKLKPWLREGFIHSLHSLAKRLGENGHYSKAIAVAREAAEVSKFLPDDNSATKRQLAARSQLLLSDCLADAGEKLLALSPARAGCREFVALHEEGVPVIPELALAAQTCANRYLERGNHEKARPYAVFGHKLFHALASRDPNGFGKTYLVSVRTLATNLAFRGKFNEAAQYSSKAVDFAKGLEEHAPGSYAVEYAESLISYSTSLDHAGNPVEALNAASLAVGVAKNSRRRVGNDNRAILGVALNNLSHRKMRLGAYRGAALAATEALRLYEGLAGRNAAYRLEIAGSLRNIAETSRLKAASKLGRRRAVAIARRAVTMIQKALDLNAEATVLLAAECDAELCRCLRDVGETKKAHSVGVRSASAKLALFQRSPAVYRAHIADALVALAELKLAMGSLRKALPLASEAVGHYRVLARRAAEPMRRHYAEALRNRGRILCGLGRRKDAQESFAKAMEVLRPAYEKCPDLHRKQFLEIAAEHQTVVTKDRSSKRVPLVH